MADDPIPQNLIDLQLAYDEAVAGTKAAGAAGEDLTEPMVRERAAQAELAGARVAAGLDGWPDVQRVMEAARAGTGK